MLRVFDDVIGLVPQSPVITSAQLIVHRILHQMIVYLATKRVLDHTNIRHDMTLDQLIAGEDQEMFGLIERLEVDPQIELEPPFKSRWTDYSARVPYHLMWVTLRVSTNARVSTIYWGIQEQHPK